MSLEIPPIPIDALKPETRDWLTAKSAHTGKDVMTLLREELDQAAEDDGFTPKKAA